MANVDDFPEFFIIWVVTEDLNYSNDATKGIHVLIRIGDCRPMAFVNAKANGNFENFVPLWQSYLDLAETFNKSAFDNKYRSAASPMSFLAINENIRKNLNDQLSVFLQRPEIHGLLPNLNDYEGDFVFDESTFEVVREWSDTAFEKFKTIEFDETTNVKAVVRDTLQDMKMPLFEELAKVSQKNEDEPIVPDMLQLDDKYQQEYPKHSMVAPPTSMEHTPLWENRHQEAPPFLDDDTSSNSKSPVQLKGQLSTIAESETTSTQSQSGATTPSTTTTPVLKATVSVTDVDMDELLHEQIPVRKRIKDKALESYHHELTENKLPSHLVAFILVVLNSLMLNKPMLTMALMKGSIANAEWNGGENEKWNVLGSPVFFPLTLHWESSYTVPWFDEFAAFPSDPGSSKDGYYENLKGILPDVEIQKINLGLQPAHKSMTYNEVQWGKKSAKFVVKKEKNRNYQYADIRNTRVFGEKKVDVTNNIDLFGTAFLTHYYGASFANKKSNTDLLYSWMCFSLKVGMKSRLDVPNESNSLDAEEKENFQLLPPLMSMNSHDYHLQQYTFFESGAAGVTDKYTRSTGFLTGGRRLSMVDHKKSPKEVRFDGNYRFTVGKKMKANHPHTHHHNHLTGGNPLFI